MTTAEQLQTTEQWVSFLKDRKPPVRNSLLSRLKKGLSDHNSSIMEIGRIIKASPVLSLHIVALAGSLHREKDSVVTSLDHAISSIGIHKLEKMLRKVPGIRLSAASVAHKQYFRAVANSHHAASQTRAWLVKNRGGMFAEESFLAALFYGVGHWMLWHSAPIHMSRIEILIRERGIAPELAERQVLGCTIASISRSLVEIWHISPLALESLKQDSPLNRQIITRLHQRALGDPRLQGDDLRSLNHLIQQKYFPVKLANWLAFTVNYGWHSEAALHIIDIINDYLRNELGQTFSFLHKNCIDSARHFHVAGTLSPAAGMLMLPSDKHPGYRLTAADKKVIPEDCPRPQPLSAAPPAENKDNTPTAETPPETDAKPARPATESEFVNEEIFQDVAKRLLKQADSFNQASEVLEQLLKGLQEGLGLERVAINLVMVKQESAKVILAQGFESGHPLPKSSHQLNNNSLFIRLYEKPGCIRIGKENRQRMKGMLPGTYSRHLSDQDCLFMSLFAGTKPIAVVYADREGKPGGVQDFHHEKFKYLCSAAGVCLKEIYKKQRPGAKQ